MVPWSWYEVALFQVAGKQRGFIINGSPVRNYLVPDESRHMDFIYKYWVGTLRSQAIGHQYAYKAELGSEKENYGSVTESMTSVIFLNSHNR
jgi:hypothetical protein